MGNSESQMFEFAENGNTKSLDNLLLTSDVNIQYQDKNGYTALHLAAKNGHYKCADLLIDRGIEIRAQDNQGSTALHYACLSGNVKVIRRILNGDPDLVACAKALLKAGGNPNATDSNGLSPADFIDNKNTELKELLTEAMKNPLAFQSRLPVSAY